MTSYHWQQQPTIGSQMNTQRNQHSFSCLAETQQHTLLSSSNQKKTLQDIKGLLKIEQLRKLYQSTVYNLLKVREHYIKDQTQKQVPQSHLKLGDAVLVRDHAREQFRPRYKDYRVTKNWEMLGLKCVTTTASYL